MASVIAGCVNTKVQAPVAASTRSRNAPRVAAFAKPALRSTSVKDLKTAVAARVSLVKVRSWCGVAFSLLVADLWYGTQAICYQSHFFPASVPLTAKIFAVGVAQGCHLRNVSCRKKTRTSNSVLAFYVV